MSLVNLIKKHKLIASSIFLLIPLFLVLTNYYFNRIGAFGCFDDCNNFIRGYFVLKGYTLFSEVFSGHMPLMNYISAIIQYIARPNDVYQLLLFHKLFLLTFSLASWIFLIYRFRWVGLAFIILYEPYKLYLFGDRFLAESIIVYLLVYLSGLVFLKFQKEKIFKWDYVLSALITWFVIFNREPFVPLVLFLFGLILWNRKDLGVKVASFIFFLFISYLFFFLHPVSDFILNVYTINKINLAAEVGEQGLGGLGLLKVLFYPVIVFFVGPTNILKVFLISLNLVFIVFLIKLFMQNKKLAIIIFITLALAGLRYVEPGTLFYSAKNMLIWYGLLIMSISLMGYYLKDKFLIKLSIVFVGTIFILGLISPNNILWQDYDKNKLINDGYAHYTVNGNIIKILSSDDSTLFVDGGDDLIYFVADLTPTYKYSWYTSLMPYYKPFVDERINMFRKNSPDFYFGNCEQRKGYNLPDFIKDEYVNFNNSGKPSCIFVRKNVFEKLSEDKLERAKELGFTPNM